MKKMILFFTVALFGMASMAQNSAPVAKAELVKFKETTFNFGKIKQGVPVTHDFAFSNVSEKAVVVETATPSCGCTTPVWPQAPVAKGKADKITAGFNAAAPGPFTKTISVKLLGQNEPVVITITGEVLSADDYAKLKKN